MWSRHRDSVNVLFGPQSLKQPIRRLSHYHLDMPSPNSSSPDPNKSGDLAQALDPSELTKTDIRPALYPTMDLTKEPVDFALFQAIPLDLMLKLHFVPVHERDGALWLAMADPLDVITQDLLRMQLKRPLRFAAAPQAQIQEVLKKSESGQKVMDEAGEALKVQVLREEDLDDEVLDLERMTDKDEAPIIRLVDTTIFNALQRRASDIHMETTATGFQIKYRIDGCLYTAAEPIDKRFASPIISRIKVMSELDIAEKR
ncbi:MAG: ATPase, T2SS/T4P/T4SS family, partial [Holophaga sp.]|nr:ATPase, T2SS/T4P/T4SS family [Holophaga sp.]